MTELNQMFVFIKLLYGLHENLITSNYITLFYYWLKKISNAWRNHCTEAWVDGWISGCKKKMHTLNTESFHILSNFSLVLCSTNCYNMLLTSTSSYLHWFTSKSESLPQNNFLSKTKTIINKQIAWSWNGYKFIDCNR